MAKHAYIEKRISADRLALIVQANKIIMDCDEIQQEIDQDLWQEREKIVSDGREVLVKVAKHYDQVALFVNDYDKFKGKKKGKSRGK